MTSALVLLSCTNGNISSYSFTSFENAYSFNGTNSMAPLLLPSFSVGSAMTIEAFVKFNIVGGPYQYIFDSQSSAMFLQLELALTSSGKMSFSTSTDCSSGVTTLTGTTTLSAGQIYHIAGVWKSDGTRYIYINGVLDGTNAGAVGSCSSMGMVRLGSTTAGALFFNGTIDEFRISNTARYTTNFTPQTTPFKTDGSTVLLLHLNDLSSVDYYSMGGGSIAPALVTLVPSFYP